ncbi:MAG: hypothetical protein ABJL67_24245 [Sulfitobacter sp.]
MSGAHHARGTCAYDHGIKLHGGAVHGLARLVKVTQQEGGIDGQKRSLARSGRVENP